jgi:hypothetical protein
MAASVAPAPADPATPTNNFGLTQSTAVNILRPTPIHVASHLNFLTAAHEMLNNPDSHLSKRLQQRNLSLNFLTLPAAPSPRTLGLPPPHPRHTENKASPRARPTKPSAFGAAAVHPAPPPADGIFSRAGSPPPPPPQLAPAPAVAITIAPPPESAATTYRSDQPSPAAAPTRAAAYVAAPASPTIAASPTVTAEPAARPRSHFTFGAPDQNQTQGCCTNCWAKFKKTSCTIL